MNLRTYVLVVLALTATPAILTASLWLAFQGVIDFADPADLLGFVLFAGLSAVALLVSANAFAGHMFGRKPSVDRGTKLLTLGVPVFWIVGGLGGLWVGQSIAGDVSASRQMLAETYCAELLEPQDPGWARCLEAAHGCDAEADAGPCGKAQLTSAEASQRCQEATKGRVEAFVATERALVELRSADYVGTWRRACLMDQARAAAPATGAP